MLRGKLLTAEANQRTLGEQLNAATGQVAALRAQLGLVRMRLEQYTELSATGAGNRFDLEQAQAQVAELEGQLASSIANQAVRKLMPRPARRAGRVAQVTAQIAQAQAQLGDAVESRPDRLPRRRVRCFLTPRPGAIMPRCRCR
jgi:multidrug resistance efflux pump